MFSINGFLKTYIKDQTGSFTIALVAGSVVLLAIIFFTFDTSKIVMDHQKLKNSVDHATLIIAGRQGMYEGKTYETAKTLIKNALGDDQDRLSSVTIDTDYATQLSIKADMKKESLLGQYLNLDEADFTWTTKVKKKQKKKTLEIVMAIDSGYDSGEPMKQNSNDSLSWGKKPLDLFKNIATAITTEIYPSRMESRKLFTDSRFMIFKNKPARTAIIPFQTYVNSGYKLYSNPGLSRKKLLDIVTFLSIQDQQSSGSWFGNGWTDHGSGGYYNYNVMWWWHTYNNSNIKSNYYLGCIFERVPNRDISLGPMFSGSWDNVRPIKTMQFMPQFKDCTVAPMLGFGFGWEENTETLYRMNPEGYRNIVTGMLWALRHLSPGHPLPGAEPFQDPNTRKETDPEIKKVVILMTSGLNSHNWFVGAYGHWILGRYLKDETGGHPDQWIWRIGLLNQWLNNRLIQVCNILKEKHVEIFVVKSRGSWDFVHKNNDTTRYIDACASKPENVYIASDGAPSLINKIREYNNHIKEEEYNIYIEK